MRRALLVGAVVGVVVGLLVATVTGEYVTLCVDGPSGGYCEEQGGPNWLAGLAAGLLGGGVAAMVWWDRHRS